MPVSTAEIVAVMGACVAERRRYAETTARERLAELVPASELGRFADPVHWARARTRESAHRVVLEFDEDIDPTEVLAAFGGDGETPALADLVCVVDAIHLGADLASEDYIRGRLPGTTSFLTARALVTAMQIEHAATIVLVGWEALTTPELSQMMAFLSHLNPRARLRLDGATDRRDEIRAPRAGGPGWVDILNEDFDPHMTDPCVSALRYEQVRPLHPDRLHALLHEIEGGCFGTVLRSAGFCRLATRPDRVARWEHVGSMFSLQPMPTDAPGPGELVSVGQDLAVIGFHLDAAELTAALDDAALDDVELTAGPALWRSFPDPFPAWSGTAQHRHE